MSPRPALLALATLLWAGCGDDSAAADLAVADLAGADLSIASGADLALGAYPAGPYGNTVGAVIPPLVWEGYADPNADAIATSKPYGAYTMDDLRRSGRKYGIVHVAAFS